MQTQNRREFATNPEEIRAFLGINYIMSISKLPNVKCYWSVDSYLSNDDVRNAMTRNHCMNILQNLHLTDNQTELPRNKNKDQKNNVIFKPANKSKRNNEEGCFLCFYRQP